MLEAEAGAGKNAQELGDAGLLPLGVFLLLDVPLILLLLVIALLREDNGVEGLALKTRSRDWLEGETRGRNRLDREDATVVTAVRGTEGLAVTERLVGTEALGLALPDALLVCLRGGHDASILDV